MIELKKIEKEDPDKRILEGINIEAIPECERNSLDDLIGYASSLGIALIFPSWVDEKKYVITSWEAEGRYNLHFVVRMDTLKRCYGELLQWRNRLFPERSSL